MSNGITFDTHGRMIVVHQGDYGLRFVSRTDMSTGKAEIVAGSYGGHPFNAPNDVIVDSKGRIFFTDPMYDHRGWEKEEQPVRGVYRIDPDGSVHLVVAIVRQPNGLALSPDESTLYVCNYDFGKNGPFLVTDDFKGDMPPVTSQLFAFDLRPDGTTKVRKILFDLSPQSGCDGIKVDEKGNIFVAAGAVPVLYVYSPEGKRLATVTLPGKDAFLLNVNFGRGKYDHTLFIAASDGIYTIETRNAGAAGR
jgi:gluconolactonase